MLYLIAGAVLTVAIVSSALIIRSKHKKSNVIKVKPIERTKTESQIKGELGEEKTAEEFRKFFKDKCKIIKNIYLKYNEENATEIDILVISEYGLFVIENKNYRGWIFGSFKDNKWTDSYPTGMKVQFYNPLKQNYTHINVLKKYLDEKYHKMIYSYVVFNDECELKKVPYNSEFIKIIKSNQITSTLSEGLKNKCIMAEEVEQLYNYLKQFTNISEEQREIHIEKVRAKIQG